MKLCRTHLSSRFRHAPPCAPRVCSHAAEAGVALVITLILLAVITFMAVTFLVISNSQKAAAGTAQQQTVARLAAGTATERCVADFVARIIATSNAFNAGLFVSQSFSNPDGFDPLTPVNPLTNVNFLYKRDGTPLTQTEMQRNLLNVLYDPGVPVYVTNRFQANSQDFRF